MFWICRFIGPPSNLPTADLPTLRQVLQKCNQVKLDSGNRWIKVPDIVSSVAAELITLWEGTNPRLKLKINVIGKIRNAYDDYMQLKRGRASKDKIKDNFTSKLDKLFDICYCT